MNSIIFTFVNYEGEECISIGDWRYYKKIARSCRQIISVLNWVHDEEQREDIVNTTQEELLCMLMGAVEDNSKYVLYLN